MGLGRGAWNYGVIIVVSIFFSMISNISPIYHIRFHLISIVPNAIGLWDLGSTLRTHLSSLGRLLTDQLTTRRVIKHHEVIAQGRSNALTHNLHMILTAQI